MLGWWTLSRASGIGVTAGLVALLLWPFYRRYGGPLEWPFAVLAGLAGLCGLSLLVITAIDMLRRRRGSRIRPVRGFDIVLGVGLAALGLLALQDVQGQLPG